MTVGLQIQPVKTAASCEKNGRKGDYRKTRAQIFFLMKMDITTTLDFLSTSLYGVIHILHHHDLGDPPPRHTNVIFDATPPV